MNFINNFLLLLIGATLAALPFVTASELEPEGNTVPGAGGCSAHDSCGSCGQDANCQWCAPTLVIKHSLASDTQRIHAPFGSCVAKAGSCDDVVVGGLTKMIKQIVPPSPGSKIQYATDAIAATHPSCNTLKSPPELFTRDCESCFDYGKANNLPVAWCDAIMWHAAGGFCVREDLAFMCRTGFIPPLSAEGLPFISVQFMFTGEKKMCGRKDPKPLPPPETECSKVSDCHSCHALGKCTYCGAVFSQQDTSGRDSDFASVFGACVDGKNQDCKNVKFGTLVPGYLTQNMGLPLRPIAANEDKLCTGVEWPTSLAEDCWSCIESDDTGWCQITMIQKGEPQPPQGLCMTKGMEYICSLQSPNSVESRWLTKGAKCAGAPPPPKSTTSTSTSTIIPSVTTSTSTSVTSKHGSSAVTKPLVAGIVSAFMFMAVVASIA